MASSQQIFVALTGDLVNSRALAPRERAEVQRHLLAWFDELNADLGPELAAPLTLTAGDEIQGLFRKPGALVEVIQELTDRLFGFPVERGWFDEQDKESYSYVYVLFGVGRGELSTGRIPSPPRQAANPALLDGPAFHRARSAFDRAKREKQWVRFEGFGATADSVLDALFGLMGTIRGRWTANQGTSSYLARRSGKQKDLAEHLRVSPSVVSETLKGARYRDLLAGERAARLFLESLTHESERA